MEISKAVWVGSQGNQNIGLWAKLKAWAFPDKWAERLSYLRANNSLLSVDSRQFVLDAQLPLTEADKERVLKLADELEGRIAW